MSNALAISSLLTTSSFSFAKLVSRHSSRSRLVMGFDSFASERETGGSLTIGLMGVTLERCGGLLFLSSMLILFALKYFFMCAG